MKICNIVAGVLCLTLVIASDALASSVEIEEDEAVLEEPQEEYFEEQTEENTVTATKTKNLKVIREEDYFEVNKRIYIGDSRTIGMCLASTNLTYTEEKTIKGYDENGDMWIAKTGEGLSWMKENDDIEGEIIQGTNIYILMGVNDCRHHNLWHLYREYLDEKSDAWSALGARLIFVSVLPLAKGAESTTTNDDIEGFNEYMKANCKAEYLDICSFMESSSDYSKDGIHYTEETYKDIYSLITTSKI